MEKSKAIVLLKSLLHLGMIFLLRKLFLSVPSLSMKFLKILKIFLYPLPTWTVIRAMERPHYLSNGRMFHYA